MAKQSSLGLRALKQFEQNES
ncbi:uncharacterized protein G2W53_024853 [Senna tora]|uniref:Uncharacterized protein n=1 Tax=Senna tora TaxID=362788 RepID=A0A834TCB4_9FABA|nr:uncharacterized protein G2W53_024853 [Senna tora]